MSTMTLVEAVRAALQEEMERDPQMVILGEDVGARGGVFRATQGFLERFGEQRVIDTPLAESAIVGVALGLALNGMHPVAEIEFADFIWGATEQIISEVARMRYRSNGDWTCPLVLRAPYGGGVGGGLYHSQSIEAFFAHVPGLVVLAPSHPHSAFWLLKASLRAQDPILFLEHKRLYRLVKGEVADAPNGTAIGKAVVRREGRQLTVVSYGLTLHHALVAAQELEGEGVSVEVVDLETLVPLDKETILTSVRKTGRVLVVYEDNLTGGFGAEVAALVAQEAFPYLDAPVTRLAGPDVPAMPFSPPLQEAFLVSKEKVLKAARELAAY